MSYNPKTAKKCTFVKMGKKKGVQKKRGSKAITSSERMRKLKEWRNSW